MEKQSVKRSKEIFKVLKKYQLLTKRSPENLRRACEELGPTFIKLGQIMADREDMLSKSYCDELRKLRSQVLPMDSYTVKAILKRELKMKINDFTSISLNPIGAASIAQVHKARLDNKVVVLKIARENMENMMETDIALLKKILKLVPTSITSNIDIFAMLDEMLKSAKEEMNFLHEEENMTKFYNKNKNEELITLPKVYKKYTTKNLLVMEYIEAPKINDVSALKYLGYDFKSLALTLSKNYIKQALLDGFYHADPHPDNIKVKDGKIVYLDFGMMGTLSLQNKRILKNCVTNIVFKDYEALAHNVMLFGTTKEVNEVMLERDLQRLMDAYLTTGLSEIDISTFAPKLLHIIKDYTIKVPKDITLLMRGIIVLEGVLEDIYPEINLMDALKSELSIKEILNKETIEDNLFAIIKNSKDLSRLPEEFLKLNKNLNHSNIVLPLKESPTLEKKKDERITLLILALLDLGFIIGTVLTSSNENTYQGLLFFFYLILFFLDTTVILVFILKNLTRKKR